MLFTPKIKISQNGNMLLCFTNGMLTNQLRVWYLADVVVFVVVVVVVVVVVINYLHVVYEKIL